MGIFFARDRDPAVAAPTAADILKAVTEIPAVADALTAAAARTVADRQRLVDTLAGADRAAETAFPILTAEMDAAIAAERKAEAAWRKAGRNVAAASHARTSASVSLDRIRTQIESALRAGADNVAVDAFITWIDHETTRTSKLTLPGDAVQVTDGRSVTTTTTTNRGAVLARLAALRAARPAADALRFLPDQSAIADRLAALRAALPPVVEEVAVTRRPIERAEDRQFGVRTA